MFGCLGSKISQVHLRLNKMANADIRKKRNALDTGPRNVDEIAGCSLATPMVFASNDTSRLQPNQFDRFLDGKAFANGNYLCEVLECTKYITDQGSLKTSFYDYHLG